MDPKKPTCRISEPKNFPQGIKWCNAKNKNIRNWMSVFVSSSYHLRPPKKILAKFSFPKKFRNHKFRTAKRSFNLPRYLKSGVSPRGYLHSWHSSKCWLLFFLFEKKGVTISLRSKQLPKNAKSSSGRGASLKSSFWSNLVNIRNLDKSLCKTLVNLCLQLLKILIEKMSWMLCISLHHQTNNWKNIPSIGFLTFKTSCTKIIL